MQSLRALFDFAKPTIPVNGAPLIGGFGPSDAIGCLTFSEFNQIQRLATPLPESTTDGVEFLRRAIFTGLTQPVGTITTYANTDAARRTLTIQREYADPSVINEILCLARAMHADREVLN
ncbi:hypothetical protein ACEPPN_008265 [Leptodophora sp. 'Broadleaf-Isolate-01']